MSYPHADPSRFDGLLPHVEHHLGPVTHGQGAQLPGGGNRGFAIGFHGHPTVRMISAATTGVRFQRVAAPLPQEYVVSALPDHEDEAGYLAHVIAREAIERQRGYAYGSGYVNAEPLIPGTGIAFLLAAPHPFADAEFDVYRDDQGEPALQLVTLLPCTRAEFEYVHAHDDDPDVLFDRWRDRDTDILDLYRKSAV
ncbi:suppressor of fused domain protein [Amycolatopsis sp. FBCC-B4732]|uniref:suppressor of fused domain protein n=1 Tax=Amycolatopsis sp. FBCC-B4732 TaxID=3079339 RepID=UPI001FF409B4|nr:suppressor of fused domain protein [Amycolatopsis sp. FBCC-B4732]UOX90919.1 suppressor of fused domain protein [Amycolatopsis sp. FBCC-B4732]